MPAGDKIPRVAETSLIRTARMRYHWAMQEIVKRSAIYGLEASRTYHTLQKDHGGTMKKRGLVIHGEQLRR